MSNIPRYHLSSHHNISRVIKGGWQLAGGHGHITQEDAVEHMRRYVQAGVTTFDCADIYTGVESLIGSFLKCYKGEIREGTLPDVQVHTKYVPDLDSLSRLQKQDVARIVDRSLQRLGVDRLDLVQFHWWDYDTPEYVEAALHLQALQDAGKIKHIGVTNFDVPRLREIVAAGVSVVSNQVQFSVLDGRPENGMTAFCDQHDIALLCYGTVAGGFLSDRYLGAPEPTLPHENRSLTKYALIIDEFGGWNRFQDLLKLLRQVADKYDTSIASVATRYILQKTGVAAAIVGARNVEHLADVQRLFAFELDQDDISRIDREVAGGEGPAGDVYDLERIRDGKHAAIMKYNLNKD